MRQSTTHEFHFDTEIMNVMFFDYDGSLYIDDSNDNAVQVHGVNQDHLLMLCRNLFCAGSKLDADKLSEHNKTQLREIRAALNALIPEGDS